MIRTHLRIGALSLLALAAYYSPANAQTAIAGSQSGSASQAAAGSQAGSAAVIQQTFQGNPAQTRTIVGYEGSYQQNYRATIRNTPDAYAPPVTGGTNPCTQGLSGGGSVAGFGLAVGGTWSDPNCERRNLSALLHNQGQQALAQEVLCETEAVRNARRRLGTPCAVDVPPGTPIVTPAPVAMREVVGGGAAPVSARVGANDFCTAVGPADNRDVRQTCGWTGPNFTRRPRA
jgi:hypothetical protein